MSFELALVEVLLVLGDVGELLGALREKPDGLLHLGRVLRVGGGLQGSYLPLDRHDGLKLLTLGRGVKLHLPRDVVRVVPPLGVDGFLEGVALGEARVLAEALELVFEHLRLERRDLTDGLGAELVLPARCLDHLRGGLGAVLGGLARRCAGRASTSGCPGRPGYPGQPRPRP